MTWTLLYCKCRLLRPYSGVFSLIHGSKAAPSRRLSYMLPGEEGTGLAIPLISEAVPGPGQRPGRRRR